MYLTSTPLVGHMCLLYRDSILIEPQRNQNVYSDKTYRYGDFWQSWYTYTESSIQTAILPGESVYEIEGGFDINYPVQNWMHLELYMGEGVENRVMYRY
jgi:hypothetical protein